MADSTEINVEKPQANANVVTSRKANVPLIVLGIVLIVCFFGGVAWSRAVGSETVETPPAASGGATGSTGANGQATATSRTTKTKSVPSESLLTAILGSGAALIVIGLLYGRISTIKLPGGVEVSMTKEAEEKTVQKSVETHPNDPAAAAAVAQEAQSLLLRRNADGGVLTDAEIGAAVHQASQLLSD